MAPKEIYAILTETLANMHHRMPPSKTGWPSLNVMILSPDLSIVREDPKQ